MQQTVTRFRQGLKATGANHARGQFTARFVLVIGHVPGFTDHSSLSLQSLSSSYISASLSVYRHVTKDLSTVLGRDENTSKIC